MLIMVWTIDRFIIGLIFAVRFMKAQSADKKPDDLSDEDIERVKSLHAATRTEQDEK